MRNSERPRGEGQPERRTPKEASDALRGRYNLPPKPDKKEKEKRQFTLTQLLIFVAGVAALILPAKWVYREIMLRERIKAYRALWDKMKTTREMMDAHQGKFLLDLEDLGQTVRNSNGNQPWYMPDMGFSDIVTDKELRQELRRQGADVFKIFQDVGSPDPSDPFTINLSRELTEQPIRVEYLHALAARGDMSVAELLTEDGAVDPLALELEKQAKQMWRHIVQMAEDPRKSDKRRSMTGKTSDGGWVIPRPFLRADGEWTKGTSFGFQIGGRALVLQEILRQAGLEKGRIIDQREAQRVLRPEIESLWAGMNTPQKRLKLNIESRDEGVARISQILALANLASLSPEEMFGRKNWREAAGNCALTIMTRIQSLQRITQQKSDPWMESNIRTLWSDLQLLFEITGMKPTDPECNIPAKEWEKLEKELPQPKSKSQEAGEEGASLLPQPQNRAPEEQQAKQIQLASKSFLRRGLEAMIAIGTSHKTAIAVHVVSVASTYLTQLAIWATPLKWTALGIYGAVVIKNAIKRGNKNHA